MKDEIGGGYKETQEREERQEAVRGTGRRVRSIWKKGRGGRDEGVKE